MSDSQLIVQYVHAMVILNFYYSTISKKACISFGINSNFGNMIYVKELKYLFLLTVTG